MVSQSLRKKTEGRGVGGFSLAPFLILATAGRLHNIGEDCAETVLDKRDALFVAAHSWVWTRYERSYTALRLTFEPDHIVAGRRRADQDGGALEHPRDVIVDCEWKEGHTLPRKMKTPATR
jgi:hypothetical protein